MQNQARLKNDWIPRISIETLITGISWPYVSAPYALNETICLKVRYFFEQGPVWGCQCLINALKPIDWNIFKKIFQKSSNNFVSEMLLNGTDNAQIQR